MPNFEVLVSEMMFDPEFARLMQTDPAAALKDLGIDPTPARLDAIKQVDIESITRAAAAIGTAQNRPMN